MKKLLAKRPDGASLYPALTAVITCACRMHRVVDASLFYFSAKGAAARYSVPRVASFISTGGRWASALQLLALATTLFAPRLIARHHELFKVSRLWSACAYTTAMLSFLLQCPREGTKMVRYNNLDIRT